MIYFMEVCMGAWGYDSFEYLEEPECSMAIAAIEVVAALNGKSGNSLPQEISDWIIDKQKPSAEIIKKAAQALDRIILNSELKELWEENEELYTNWIEVIKELKERLY
jgi:transcriptional regulator with XRE-family HTH domain